MEGGMMALMECAFFPILVGLEADGNGWYVIDLLNGKSIHRTEKEAVAVGRWLARRRRLDLFVSGPDRVIVAHESYRSGSRVVKRPPNAA